ncbi:MAG: L-lactate permease [Luteolibacter sp.]
MNIWTQDYNPLHHASLSTLAATLPAIVLLACIGIFRIRVHFAAAAGLAFALFIAIFIYRMPADAAIASGLYGAAFGLFPIGWIILNVVFLYQLTVKRGHFDILRGSLVSIAPDPRIQVILVAFAFGAFLEGMAGFGAPIAITAALLLQFGFSPLQAASLALIGNTAPVAFGSLGIPITTMEQVTGIDDKVISAIVGRQLPFFALILPCWLVVAFAGWRGLRGIWPVALVAGLAFAIPQFLVSNFHGPWLVDIIAGVSSMFATVVFIRFWKPKDRWSVSGREIVVGEASEGPLNATLSNSRSETFHAWLPWIILTLFIFVWGTPQSGKFFDSLYLAKIPVPHLDGVVQRVSPIVAAGVGPEAALFKFNFLSASGTGILLASLLAGVCMRFSLREMFQVYCRTAWQLRLSLLTIATMLALGHVTKYSGSDATMGLALAQTGAMYPFFGTLLGWIGVAVTGSDTSSNVLFGSLQKITAQQIGINPALMCAANTSGGVMGKMVAAQSIVVASTATHWYGHEGEILRRVFLHSLALVLLMALLVYLQAYVFPFTWLLESLK